MARRQVYTFYAGLLHTCQQSRFGGTVPLLRVCPHVPSTSTLLKHMFRGGLEKKRTPALYNCNTLALHRAANTLALENTSNDVCHVMFNMQLLINVRPDCDHEIPLSLAYCAPSSSLGVGCLHVTSSTNVARTFVVSPSVLGSVFSSCEEASYLVSHW